MKVIGLTGSVGSGKTTIARILEKDFGAFVIIADIVGHYFMEPGQEVFDKIVEHFGTEILTKGKIDRKKLGEASFKKEKEINFLNSIIHPCVKNYILQQIEEQKRKQENSCIVIEAALLIEAGYLSLCDEMWYVTADDFIRRKRLKETRGYTDEKINIILKNQLSDEDFRRNCTKILYNNSDIAKIKEQIENLLEL